jgi:endonuclease/exonuclease/phosphatase family metal-dependent hydrolase
VSRRLLVRTWNVFHGNALPPRRTGFLRRMIELVTADRPDVVCLQEVPVWALRQIEVWSGMTCFGAMARRPVGIGAVSAWITRTHQGRFRSGLAGQANVILVAPSRSAEDLGSERISDAHRERRIVHAVRLLGPPSVVVGNLHATNDFHDPGVPRREAARAREVVDRLAGAGEPVVLAGDFNVADPQLAGFSAPVDGIDHVLVRGAEPLSRVVWPVERRTVDGIVLSDHAPTECVMEVPG